MSATETVECAGCGGEGLLGLGREVGVEKCSRCNGAGRFPRPNVPKRPGSYYCRYCDAAEAMPGHEC